MEWPYRKQMQEGQSKGTRMQCRDACWGFTSKTMKWICTAVIFWPVNIDVFKVLGHGRSPVKRDSFFSLFILLCLRVPHLKLPPDTSWAVYLGTQLFVKIQTLVRTIDTMLSTVQTRNWARVMQDQDIEVLRGRLALVKLCLTKLTNAEFSSNFLDQAVETTFN